jgi:hypothetical protein
MLKERKELNPQKLLQFAAEPILPHLDQQRSKISRKSLLLKREKMPTKSGRTLKKKKRKMNQRMKL